MQISERLSTLNPVSWLGPRHTGYSPDGSGCVPEQTAPASHLTKATTQWTTSLLPQGFSTKAKSYTREDNVLTAAQKCIPQTHCVSDQTIISPCQTTTSNKPNMAARPWQKGGYTHSHKQVVTKTGLFSRTKHNEIHQRRMESGAVEVSGKCVCNAM